MEHNIDTLRKRAGLTVKELAERSGISRDYLNKLKAGNKRLNIDVMKRLATTLKVQPGEIISPIPRQVPIVGNVGAGGGVHPIDDLAAIPSDLDPSIRDEINCEWVDAPPGYFPAGIMALRVIGDSMEPIVRPGSIIYYAQRYMGGAPESCISRLCVVQISDGSTMVKIVEKSHFHGRFDLVSTNSERVNEVNLAWCAPVIFIKPA